MAADLQGFTKQEVLNKVLNTSNDSLQVDIVDATGVTITTSNESVYADDADWTDDTSKHTLVGGLYQGTPQGITDGDTGPLQVNAAGNLIVDVIGGGVLETLVDGVETLLGTIDGDTSTIAAAVDTQMQVDVVASLPAGDNNIGNVDIASSVGLTVDLGSNNDIQIASGQVASGAFVSGSVADGAMVTLGAKADAKSASTDGTSITAMQVLKQISASVQETATDTGTIDSDTDDIKDATEATQSALEKMLYGNALVITAVDGGSTQALGATYESLYVGVGGNVVVTMVGTGNFTFSNVASGQLLPIRITHVINTNTTATNMIAVKA